MGERVFNFSAGPATLPLPVLEEAQATMVSLPDIGASPLELSHRSPWFEGVIEEAAENLRGLLAIPDGFHIVFCQGGATQQFSMVAMNLQQASGRAAEYVVTGSWGERAAGEAMTLGPARVAWSGKDDGYVRTPDAGELHESVTADAAYVHITSNETIQGVEWWPETPIVPDGVPLVCDSSSDFLSRPVDVARYAILYACAQKNAGPAGVTVAIVRDDVPARIPGGLPTILDYRTYTSHGSLYNTPPVFAIYVLMLVTRWLRDQVGGLAEQLRINRDKAGLLYEALDESDGFYRGHAVPASRSLMNVTWRLPTEELDRTFVAEAAAGGMIELRGHRSVGGIRASIYNAMPLEGARDLAAFMRTFAAVHG
ncbi:MAG: 3-phosphoserine/phosphohydroxythreonine transaminase [Actinomycetota bacterium]|nr:3-phosphoserine/phosphohydroxythreonine transaminase [Actinomycetota bacterium]